MTWNKIAMKFLDIRKSDRMIRINSLVLFREVIFTSSDSLIEPLIRLTYNLHVHYCCARYIMGAFCVRFQRYFHFLVYFTN